MTNKQVFKIFIDIKERYYNKKMQVAIWDRMAGENTRQALRTLIDELIDLGFIKKDKKIRTTKDLEGKKSKGFKRSVWIFKLSNDFIELLKALKDYVFKKQGVKTSNINDKIEKINTLDILQICKEQGFKIKKKGKKYKILDYIFTPYRQGNLLYDIIEEKSINLFNMVKKELNLSVFETYNLFINKI